jgi:hypothetical protein
VTVKLDDAEALKDAFTEVENRGFVMVEREGKPVGALVSLEFLETIEDASWRKEIQDAMADPNEISWEAVKAKSRSS